MISGIEHAVFEANMDCPNKRYAVKLITENDNKGKVIDYVAGASRIKMNPWRNSVPRCMSLKHRLGFDSGAGRFLTGSRMVGWK
jgi:hypothetical protein